jgi:hypothetical protein
MEQASSREGTPHPGRHDQGAPTMSGISPIQGALRPLAADALPAPGDTDPMDPRRLAAHALHDDKLPQASLETLPGQAQGLTQWLQQGPELELGALPSRDLSSSASAPKPLPAIDPSPMDREHVLERRAETIAGDWLSPAHAAAHRPPTATPPGTVDLPLASSRGESGDLERERG